MFTVVGEIRRFRPATPDGAAWQSTRMSDITVRVLDETDWAVYRAVRLRALQDSPDAFVNTHAEEAAQDDEFWRARMRRAKRLVASQDEQDIGVVCVGHGDQDRENEAQLFGLWVAPERRGSGVASALVQAGADTARAAGHTHLTYWVGTDNGRAVAFASGFGFRPADARRPMRVTGGDADEEEILMTLPLGDDRGIPTSY
jgi:ribosomal protein S18 acetylase RimI-like enzyme